ncbi:hypothetical protein IV203_001516 [Nitzschia inconspicua]|uniref:Inositol polyphosphate-related phosphatase domain-containing protein n=1 Tax=Nitzschia inconspicua TaxID=303405 RepID=A0A9K3PR43_9STRA|nr:hypothetical protein IV203_001516 [Nitzschia inconspicua]
MSVAIATKIPSPSDHITGWTAVPSFAPTLPPQGSDSPLEASFSEIDKQTSGKDSKETSGKKRKKRKQSETSTHGSSKTDPRKCKRRKSTGSESGGSLRTDPTFGIDNGMHSRTSKSTAFHRERIPSTKPSWLTSAENLNHTKKRKATKKAHHVSETPSGVRDSNRKKDEQRRRNSDGSKSFRAVHPPQSRNSSYPQTSPLVSSPASDRVFEDSARRRKKIKRKGKRSTSVMGETTSSKRKFTVESRPKVTKKRRKSKKSKTNTETEHAMIGTKDIEASAGHEASQYSHGETNVKGDLSNDSLLLDQATVGDATDEKSDLPDADVVTKLTDAEGCSASLTESSNRETGKPKDLARIGSSPVLIESTVVENDGPSKDLSEEEAPVPERSETEAEKQNELSLKTTTEFTEVMEKEKIIEYVPNIREVEVDVNETASCLLADNASDEVAMREVTDRLVLSSEEQHNEDVADQMETYEPTLLESPTADSSVNQNTTASDDVAMQEVADKLVLSSEEQHNEDAADRMETYKPTLLESPTTDSSVNQNMTVPLIEETNEEGSGSTGQFFLKNKDLNINPDQDVVSFIGDVLQEDVKEWVTDADSFSEILGNKTRGGHSTTDPTSNRTEHPEVDTNVQSPSVLDGMETDTEKNPSVGAAIQASPTSLTLEDRDEHHNSLMPNLVAVDRESLEAEEDKDSDISVSVVTWNLAEESPLEEQATFLRAFRKNGIRAESGSDLILISGQECENIKPRRSEGRRSREFRRLMVKMLGKDYVPIGLHLLGGIQFGLFAKRSILKEIEDVAIADVTCGIGNVFHNKGAIAAFLTMRSRNDPLESQSRRKSKYVRLAFVTAHMAAHVKNSEARDADFWRISSELESAAPEGFLSKGPQKMNPGSSFFDSIDRVFFCGDLNYRLDLPRELTEFSVVHGVQNDERSLSDLFRYDQLIRSMTEGRAFPGFVEGRIAFAPTFKFDKETNMYDTSHKQRIPAWTDRILFRPSSGIRVKEYSSVPSAQHSDHRPVFGVFRVNMEGRDLPKPKGNKPKRKKGGSTAKSGRRESE